MLCFLKEHYIYIKKQNARPFHICGEDLVKSVAVYEPHILIEFCDDRSSRVGVNLV